jgi:DNA-binding NarL/FixJ family response regulator
VSDDHTPEEFGISRAQRVPAHPRLAATATGTRHTRGRRCDWCAEPVASGYIHEACVWLEIEAILEEKSRPSPKQARKRNVLKDLTEAELRRLVGFGLSDRQIAERLGVNHSTIQWHRKRHGIVRAA